MRRLPAALFAAVSAVPVLTSAVGLPAGLPAVLPAGLPAALPAGMVATMTGAAALAAGGTQAGGAVPAPVATKVRQVALSGVDPAADRSLTAAGRPASTHGAPGALARMA